MISKINNKRKIHGVLFEKNPAIYSYFDVLKLYYFIRN